MQYTQYRPIPNPRAADCTLTTAPAATDILARPDGRWYWVLVGQGGYSEMLDPYYGLAVAAGDELTFTPQSTVRPTGGSPFDALLAYEDVGDPEVAWIVGGVRLKNINTIENFGSDRAITSLVVDMEEHLNPDPIVATSDDLPSGSGRLQFMIRYVTADSVWVRYDSEATSTSYGARYAGTPSGYWVDYPFSNKAKVADLTLPGSGNTPDGNDASIAQTRYPIRSPIPISNLSATHFYGLRLSSELLQANTLINWRFYSSSGNDVTRSLSDLGALHWRLLGSVNRNDADLVLDTNWSGVGESNSFSLNNPLELSKALNPDNILIFSLYLDGNISQIVADELQIEISDIGSAAEPNINDPNVGGDEDAIYAAQSALLVVPNGIYPGTASIGGKVVTYSLHSLSGANDDSNDQWVIANTSRQARIEPSSGYAPTALEIKRAQISTEAGSGPWSSSTQIVVIGGAASIEITLNNPYTGNQWEIRGDYPDAQLASGGVSGLRRPPQVEVIVETGGTYYLQPTTYATSSSASQLITLTSIDTGTPIAFPTPDADFGLYQAGITSLVEGLGGSITAGTYNIFVAFNYPSPNGVFTKINHEATGVAPSLPDLTEHIQDETIHLNFQEIVFYRGLL